MKILRAMIVMLFVSAGLFVRYAGAETTESANLLPNPGLEIAGDNGLPQGWHSISVWGGKGKFAIDSQEKHSGKQSVRIDCEESSQSYITVDAFPVAPGEMFSASAWVKARNIELGEESGKVQIQAVLIREDAADEGVTVAPLKIAASKGSADWTHIEGDFKVPPQTVKVFFRFGMHDATGTTWWDDLELHAHQQLSIRADVKGAELLPDAGGVPVTVVNRSGARIPVQIKAKLGSEAGSAKLDLNGDVTQSLVVPLEMSDPGTLDCIVTLLDADNKPTFTQKRKVTVPPPISLMPPIPTHGVIEDGPVDLAGDVELAMTDQQRQGAVISVQLLDANNRSIASWKSSAPLTNGFNHWEIKAAALPPGDYRVAAEFAPRSGKPLTDQQAWHVIHRDDAKVTLNKDGYLEYKGNAIYPLGIFNGNGKMKEMADAGFTVSHAYNAVDVVHGELPPDLKAQEFLDNTEKAGMKALFLVPRGFLFHGDWDLVRRRIRMFKNHPALLAWDEEEGIARGDMTRDDLKKLRAMIAEEDPNHPLMIGDSHDGIRKITDRSDFFPLTEMDLGMWWWYPIPPGGASADALQGEELTKAMQLDPPTFLTQRNTDKPIWVGVQSYKKPPAWARFPTPIEYRAQAYISIIDGAKGLMWYGGGIAGGIYGNPEAAHWDALKALAKELNEMSPVFMAPSGESPRFDPPAAPICVLLKTMPDRAILLTGNRGASPVDVTFHLASKEGSVKVLTENRAIAIRNGELKDHFDPYVVHVYQLPEKK